jgi:hypothetical protein
MDPRIQIRIRIRIHTKCHGSATRVTVFAEYGSRYFVESGSGSGSSLLLNTDPIRIQTKINYDKVCKKFVMLVEALWYLDCIELVEEVPSRFIIAVIVISILILFLLILNRKCSFAV